MKKGIIAILLIAALIVPAFAEGTKEKAVEPAKKADYITLMASQNWIKDIDRELFKEFEEETGIEVKVNVTPDGSYESLLSTTLSGGGDAIDIFMYGSGFKFVSDGMNEMAYDLSGEEWVSRLEPWAKDVSTLDGEVYGLNTWSIDYEGVLYNKTFFEENGLEIPHSYAEFKALCDRIVELGKVPLYEGINGVWHAQGWIYSLAPALLAEDPDFAEKLNNQEADLADYKCAQQMASEIEDFFGAKDADGNPKYFMTDGQAEDWFGSYPALVNRDAVMMHTYSAYANELAAQGSTDVWGMFPSPFGSNSATVHNGGGILKSVNKFSEKIDESLMLLEFLARPENLDRYYAARSDFSSSSFPVTTLKQNNSTLEAVSNNTTLAPAMLLKCLLYWSPDIYKDMQGIVAGTTTGMDLVNNIDAYRASMFDAAL